MTIVTHNKVGGALCIWGVTGYTLCIERDIEDIQIFRVKRKNAYFMSGEATNEIYIFLLHEMEINGIFMTKI